MTQSALRILAATDFSSRSDRALRRAGQLARQLGGILTITHVVDDDQPTHLIELETREAEKLLAEQVRLVPELGGVECNPLVVVGDAFDGILRTAEERSAALIVMGSHRRQLLRDIFVGTTIERVTRSGNRPVLMVNRDPGRPYHRILVAVDLSDASKQALMSAKDLGLFEQSRVFVAHAFTAVGKGTLYIADAKQREIEKYIRAEGRSAEMELKEFVDNTSMELQRVSYFVREGDPYETVANAAKETNADLVVIGTQGRNRVAKFILGSVAEKILRGLDADILAVPSRPIAADV